MSKHPGGVRAWLFGPPLGHAGGVPSLRWGFSGRVGAVSSFTVALPARLRTSALHTPARNRGAPPSVSGDGSRERPAGAGWTAGFDSRGALKRVWAVGSISPQPHSHMSRACGGRPLAVVRLAATAACVA